jgi:vitamin B12 transporter
MNYFIWTCISLLIGACVSPVLAQEKLEQITITANRVEQSADALMTAVTVITRQEIEASLAQNLNDLLLGKTGVHIAQSGSQGSQTSLFLRATESDHTLILIDGVQMTTATGMAARLELIPLDQVESIELVRGPRSSIYGSEAIGGVLQIFTRGAGEEAFDGSLNMTAGTQSTANSNLNLSGKVESTSFGFSYSNKETEGIDSKVSGSPDNDGFSNDSLALSLFQQFTKDTALTLRYSKFNAESEYDDGTVDGDSEQFSALLDFSISEIWNASFAIDSFTEDNLNVGAFGTTESIARTRSVRWDNTINFSDQNSISIGFDAKDQQLDYASFGALQTENSRDNKGLYGVYLRSAEVMDITLSLRNDDDEGFGSHSTGSIALGKSFNESIRIWTSLGTAYKAPNLIDLYVDFPSFLFSANPRLDPETSRNLEFGLELTALDTSWKFNLFRNEIDDLITSNATFSSLDNIDKVEINGLEVSASRELSGWALNLALTLLDHENVILGDELLRRPNSTFLIQASRQFNQLTVALDWLMQEGHKDLNPFTFASSDVGGYGLVNLVTGYQFSDSLALRLKVGNLFDKGYRIVDGFNTYGRTAQLAINYHF